MVVSNGVLLVWENERVKTVPLHPRVISQLAGFAGFVSYAVLPPPPGPPPPPGGGAI